MKVLVALLMLGVIAFLSYLFGIGGLIAGVCMSIVLSMMFSRQDREKLEEKRHQELLDAAKNNAEK